MDQDLLKAKEILNQWGCTCVFCRGSQSSTFSSRGVAPLLDLLQQGHSLNGFSAADKVVGKGAALLYCLLNVRQIYTPVISEAAFEVLKAHGIPVFYDLMVPGILNRSQTGPCPIEHAVAEISDPVQAYGVILDTLRNLQTEKEIPNA